MNAQEILSSNESYETKLELWKKYIRYDLGYHELQSFHSDYTCHYDDIPLTAFEYIKCCGKYNYLDYRDFWDIYIVAYERKVHKVYNMCKRELLLARKKSPNWLVAQLVYERMFE